MSPRKGGLTPFLPGGPGPQVTPLPAPGVRPEDRRSPRARARRVSGAWERVLAARWSAYDEPGAWRDCSVRLPRAVALALAARVSDDYDRTGDRGLALCHYVDAALEVLPDDPARAADAGARWRQEHRDPMPDVIVKGTRLRRDTAEKMSRITRRLGHLGTRRVRAWEVCAAAVAALLEELSAIAGSEPGQD